ncbi:MAG: hypothetical protein AAGA09_01650 [Pseudomonadota bacterium]
MSKHLEQLPFADLINLYDAYGRAHETLAWYRVTEFALAFAPNAMNGRS